jgi:hypothetical protein
LPLVSVHFASFTPPLHTTMRAAGGIGFVFGCLKSLDMVWFGSREPPF